MYRIIKETYFDDYGLEKKPLFFVEKYKSFLWFKYWCRIKEKSFYGKPNDVRFKTLADAQKFIEQLKKRLG
jgi:hypothetical protein